MKLKIFTLSFTIMLAAVMTASAQRSFLSNYGVSVNAGLTGIGATGSVALHKNLNARVGFGVLPYTYKYTYDDMPEVYSEGEGHDVELPPVKLKAKLNVPAAHVLLDYSPFKQGMGAFHLTVGLYMGGSNLVHVNGSIDMQEIERLGINYQEEIDDIYVEIGNATIRPTDDGKLDAYMKVNSVKPYFGIGWGNAIPKGRVGFRFDIGAMYHGKPEITSPTMQGTLDGEDMDDFNKILSKVQFWPQLSFALTFRLLKDKKPYFRK